MDLIKNKNFFSKIISVLSSCRIDIKNIGDKTNSIEVISIGNMTVIEPKWFSDECGIGKSFRGDCQHNVILLKVHNDGKLKLWFRGQDKYYEKERFPIWIDYKSIKIDDTEKLLSPIATWHDKPYCVEIPVINEQIVQIEFQQVIHMYSKDELKDTLSKLYPEFNFIDVFYEYYKDIANLRKSKYSWWEVKNSFLTQTPKCITLDELSDKTFGRLQISIGSTKFESVFVPSTEKKLYVSLAAIGSKGTEYPKFSRVSWCEKFSGNYICFDDPTRFEQDFAPAYFFGTKKENYLAYLQKIIEKFSSIHNISDENITFISSSNGGFASLWLADKFIGSKCIALCPQVDTTKFKDNWFCRKVEVADEMFHYIDRLQVLNILKNTKSKFFIFSNILCDNDKSQMEILYNEAGIQFKLGLSQLSPTVKCLLAEVDAPDPHTAQPAVDFVKTIECTMTKDITRGLEELYDSYVNEMKEIYAEKKIESA